MGVRKESRHFSREFKRDAVQLVLEKGVPVKKVARDLDIHPNLLHQWRRQFQAEGDVAFVGKGNLKPEDAELKRLQKELEEVKEEGDILKKPWASFPNGAGKVLVRGETPGSLPPWSDVQGLGSLSKWLLCMEEAKTG